jgi:hypothetical protein
LGLFSIITLINNFVPRIPPTMLNKHIDPVNTTNTMKMASFSVSVKEEEDCIYVVGRVSSGIMVEKHPAMVFELQWDCVIK